MGAAGSVCVVELVVVVEVVCAEELVKVVVVVVCAMRTQLVACASKLRRFGMVQPTINSTVINVQKNRSFSSPSLSTVTAVPLETKTFDATIAM